MIEDALRAHPAVDEAAVVALPDARLGEVPAVAVTLRPLPGQAASPVTVTEASSWSTSRPG